MSPYKPYPVCKTVIAKWLRSLPDEWKHCSLKWICRRYAGGTPDKTVEAYWENGIIPWLASGEVNQRLITTPSTFITEEAYNNSSAKWVPSGALVMALAGQGRTRGTVAQLAIDATCNQSMAAIVPNGIYSRFLYWWLESNYSNLRGLSGDDVRDGLNLELLGDIPCPLPSNSEQRAISAHLDRETFRIDQLISNKTRFIDLLREKRQALITHTVTKGLNPNVKMRSPGVELLGDIPEHWDRIPLSRISTRTIVGIAEAATHAYVDKGVPILRSTNIRPYKITGEILHVATDFAFDKDSKIINAGDLITVRTGNAGVTAVVPPELDGCQCFTLLITTLKPSFNADFCCYWMNSAAASHYFSIEGWGTAQVNISVPILKNLLVPFPPLKEQLSIVAYLNRETARIDSLISKTERSIELLKERRSALIIAAVTGEIDVRGACTEQEQLVDRMVSETSEDAV